ncbi:MAG: DUF503 domain-containing protein [Acidobacteria bacterium]|nr:DUF503 domain-containing protein [Acidobacteriota bacterium]HRR13531.1 DUF503 domain-containing protein [Thermoanaerobaculia bacterium]HRS37006.1 DUF503 domain-containing protein [Thermoanaerobaculia bacterium]
MFVAIVCCELHLPHAGSLKSKRRVVRSLLDRLHERARVSVAETAFHDLHQRAEIGIAAVAAQAGGLERLCDELRRLVDAEPEAVVTRWDAQLLEEAP